MHAAGYIRYACYMPWEEQSRFREFLEVIRDYRTSPLEIALILFLLALFIAANVLVYRHQKKQREQRRKKWVEAQFRGLADHFNIREEDRGLIEGMAKYIPDGELRKHELLRSEHVFDAAAREAISRGEADEEKTAALRVQLRFPPAGEREEVHSSSELPRGKVLSLADEGRRKYGAVVSGINPEALFLSIEDGRESTGTPPEGCRLQVSFQQKSGIYTFSTRVISSETGTVSCEHSDAVRKEQRRRFYREELFEEISFKKAGDESWRRTLLCDLGGEGAKVENPEYPETCLGEGEEVALVIEMEKIGAVELPGVITAVSEGGKIYHVRFSRIPESIRDTIFAYIFSR